MNYLKFKPIFLSALFFLNFTTSVFSSKVDLGESESRKEDFVGTVAGKHIRFSAQTTCPNVKAKLKFLSVKLPNGALVPLDFDRNKEGRIPVCDFYPFSEEEEITLKLVGHSKYEGCSSNVLLYPKGFKTPVPSIKPQIKGSRKVVSAVRLVIEDRLASKIKDLVVPEFVRANAYVKFEEKGKKTKQLDKKVKSEHSDLAPEGTYANDFSMLEKVISDSAFIHIKERGRVEGYRVASFTIKNEGIEKKKSEDEEELNDNIVFAIGEYVKRANEKYGKPSDKTKRYLINFFVQHNLISRLEVKLVEEMLGL
ncbi:MAG TPA: hypothetical protein DD412_05980 [Holosporales bacterium]|nr:hypothetical protein [Holosporales bacterium]